MRLVKQLLNIAAEHAAAFLFPKTCSACGRRVDAGPGLCGECWRQLRFLEKPWCDCLGTPFALDIGEGALSASAIASPPVFDRARAAVAYEGPAKRLARGLKFHDRTELSPMMAGWMVRAGEELARDADLVVPVPLHRRRMLQRGYNQSAELARYFAAHCSLPYEPAVLARVRVTRQQVGLTARQREQNVRGAFGVSVEKARGKRILLIDDVYTTGATVSSAARALKRAGARGVDVLTFARVMPEDYAR